LRERLLLGNERLLLGSERDFFLFERRLEIGKIVFLSGQFLDLVLKCFLDLKGIIKIRPNLRQVVGSEYLHEERLAVRFLHISETRLNGGLIYGDRLFRLRNGASGLLYLELGGVDLALRQGDPGLYLFALEIKRVDGCLKRLLVRADLFQFGLIGRDLLGQVRDLLIIGIYLRLERT
jgi:hypothetical protein